METQTEMMLDSFFANSPILKEKCTMRRQGFEACFGSHSKFITNSFGNNTDYLLATNESALALAQQQHPLITSRFNINIPSVSSGKQNIKSEYEHTVGSITNTVFIYKNF